MASEAQRLMMMSLGKIQGCRQQRGGINLYKSLLVSKVLYRARSVVLSEHHSPRREQQVEEEEDQRVPEVEVPEPHVVPSPESEMHEAEVECDFHDDEDKENSTPVSNAVSGKPHNEPVHTPEDFQDKKDCQAAPRCTKRRLTEVEQAVESISPKKQKLEEYNYPEQEPMQVEQISSLVSSFNSGFTGLLTSDSDNFSSDENSQTDDNNKDIHTPESSLLSCSNQIKESFDILSRPIALSV